MAQSRLSLLGALFRSGWVRGAAGIAAILGLMSGYQTVQGEFPAYHLPNLGDFLPGWVAMTISLLPWWGWVLSIFVYALFEYVRVNVPSQQTDPPLAGKAGQSTAEPKYCESTRMDWTPWKSMPYFTVEQFAKILARDDPGHESRITTHANSYRQLVLAAVKTRQIALHKFGEPRHLGDATFYTKINRVSAIAWAQSKGLPVNHIE